MEMTLETQNQRTKAYNDEAEAVLQRSITWGNMQTPRVNFSDITGVPINDNVDEERRQLER